jgi:oxaloacetate decarboxylase gamma subunit
MVNELLQQGLTLMLAGMGTVFVFLMVLVAGMTLMSRTIMRVQRKPESSAASDAEVAAISAAISKHRNS